MSAPLVVWLGSAAPERGLRWLDGALAAAAAIGSASALAAGDERWLDLATERAARAGMPSIGVSTKLDLDYLGWAQIAAAAVRKIGATRVLVDEASRPDRFADVAAIAEQLDAVQLTAVVSVTADGDALHAERVIGARRQVIRITGPCVLGVRMAAPVAGDDDVQASTGQRFDLKAIGLDANVLAHRAPGPRAGVPPLKTVEQIADVLALYRAPRGD
jgi:hypothetical protein